MDILKGKDLAKKVEIVGTIKDETWSRMCYRHVGMVARRVGLRTGGLDGEERMERLKELIKNKGRVESMGPGSRESMTPESMEDVESGGEIECGCGEVTVAMGILDSMQALRKKDLKGQFSSSNICRAPLILIFLH